MKDENIFESVQFINEAFYSSALAAVLSSNYFAAALISVVLVGGIINKTTGEKDKIRKALKNALNHNKDLKPLKERMKKGVRIISANQLADRIKISDKDIEVIKKNDVSIMIIVDKDDKLIAYCIVAPGSRNTSFGYTIVDKSLNNKEIDWFIRASFELKIGIAGDGIKHFIKKPGDVKQKDSTAKDIENHANYLSNNESKEAYKIIKDFANILNSKVKNIIPGVKAENFEEDKDHNHFYINLVCDKIYYSDYSDAREELDDDEYDELYNKDEEVFDKILAKLKAILKAYEFSYNGNHFTSSDDKYKYIRVGLDTEEGFGSYYITISNSKRIKI